MVQSADERNFGNKIKSKIRPAIETAEDENRLRFAEDRPDADAGVTESVQDGVKAAHN